MKIAIQGVKASFHDVAARKYFADREIEPVECPSFKTLSQSLKNREREFDRG
jgi:prephenate dehydratase